MIESLVHVRFDLVRDERKRDQDHTAFLRADLPCVPDVGELINLEGDPFIVIERGWAYEKPQLMQARQLYAFLRIRRMVGT